MEDERVLLATIIERMCGSINPKGETYHDKEVMEHLDKLFGVINILLDDVQYSMDMANREKMYWSVRQIFEKEKSYLEGVKENIETWLSEVE